MNWISKIVPAQVAPLFSLFSQKAHTVFVIMLIISIILALIGIVALIFGWKMKFKEENLENKKSASLNQISREEIREMIREELYKKIFQRKKTNKSNLPKKKGINL